MIKWICCRIFNYHYVVSGPLLRSPHTVHTHYRNIECSICKIKLGILVEYHDATIEPELFK